LTKSSPLDQLNIFMAAQNSSGLHPEGAPDNELSRLPTQDDLSIGEVPRPAFSNVYGQMDLTGAGLNTQAAITGEYHVCSLSYATVL
jgi:hypothetical protein